MQGHTADPIVNKYIAAGLSREAVPVAVSHFGDNPTKVTTSLGFIILSNENSEVFAWAYIGSAYGLVCVKLYHQIQMMLSEQ